jgi:hypothetical protein
MYWVYVGHCQKDKGRVELPSVSGLTRGRYKMHIYNNASCADVLTLSRHAVIWLANAHLCEDH